MLSVKCIFKFIPKLSAFREIEAFVLILNMFAFCFCLSFLRQVSKNSDKLENNSNLDQIIEW